MERMKTDMGGAASILGTMRAIALLKPKVNVIAAIPSSENMPSGSAIRPGDVLHHRGGKTSEVLNTDAEGRLVLADALAYLAETEAAGDHRHGHAHRRVHGRARRGPLGRDGQRPRAHPRRARRGRGRGRARLGAPDVRAATAG